MARIWQTGFETGSTAIFDVQIGNARVTNATPRGSWSSYALDFSAGSPAIATLSASPSELYFGVAIKNSGWASKNIISFKSPNGTANVTFTTSGGGVIQARRGGTAGTVIGTGTAVLGTSIWIYFEGRIVISDTVGIITTKVNGTQDINISSQDTRNDAATGGDTCSQIEFETGTEFDDVWVNDTTGTQNTGFSGDVRISAYIPNADGDNVTMSLSTGSSHSGLVDERPPNTTDYIYGTGTTEYDLLNIPNTSGISQVQAVTLWLYAAKSDAGAANIAHVVKYDSDNNGTADTESAGSDLGLSTTYTYYGKIYNTDPAGNAWSAAKVDALQIGAKSR